MQSALGGAEAIASIHDYEQVERADTWDNKGKGRGVVRKRVRFIRPNYLRIDQIGPGDTYVLYFDGSSGWEILPDKRVANLAGGELTFAKNYLKGLNLNSWLADRNPENLVTYPAPNVVAIATRGDPQHKSLITLDAQTFLPLKESATSHADPDHPVPAETSFDQWRAVDGVKFPFRIVNFHSGKKLAEISVEQIKLNRGLKPSGLAAKPQDLKPVMIQQE